MRLEYIELEGYWLATGRLLGRTILVEGSTRDSALFGWLAVAVERG